MALKLLGSLTLRSKQLVAPQFHFSARSFSKSSIANMRFIQFQYKDNHKRLGVLAEDGCTLKELGADLPNDLVDLMQKNLSAADIEKHLKSETLKTDDVHILPAITRPEKILCVGLNYKDHCEEQNKAAPEEPMFFSKFNSTLVGARDNVIAHAITTKIDWEVELAVVIGKEARMVKQENAMDYVFGYAVAQDISARDWQKSRNGGQFLIGKSMDTFCPLGPAVVQKSLVKDVNNLKMTTFINGVEKQNGNTSQLIFKIDDIISRLTQSITLKPGDVILTGTPKGVGMYRNPPEYLKAGDVIESEIQGLGKMRNVMVAPCTCE